jgi:acetylornithine deacetylase
LNIGVIEGGVAPNVLAPHAKARLMMRPTDDPHAIVERIRGLLSPTTTLTIKSQAAPIRLHTVDGEETCIVAFGSDVPHLSPLLHARRGSPMLFGPGSILVAHTDNEGVHVDELARAVDAYERMSLHLLENA